MRPCRQCGDEASELVGHRVICNACRHKNRMAMYSSRVPKGCKAEARPETASYLAARYTPEEMAAIEQRMVIARALVDAAKSQTLTYRKDGVTRQVTRTGD